MANIVVKGVKLIREDNYLMQDSGTIAANQEELMYKYGSPQRENYTVNQEECVELLKFGFSPDTHASQIRVTDREYRQWNAFSTLAGEGQNTLPFNVKKTFEEQMMDWGYTPYIAKQIANVTVMAPTVKFSEGDKVLIYQGADGTGISSGSRAVLLTRRYLKGSSVDFKHFDTEDGGLQSGKKFHNDDQTLATTIAGLYTRAWQYDFLKNEAFKYFNLGIEPGTTAHLVSAKVMIDDPEKQYNEYFCAKSSNQLPYVDTVDINTAVAAMHYINEMPQLVPTIDTVKGKNKNLRVYLKDDGTVATGLRTRFVGVRYAD